MSEHSPTQPLILITNDDGIQSPALHAACRAAQGLGDVLVVAPDSQWSGAGRSLPHHLNGGVSPYPLEVEGREVTAYQVDGSPAAGVLYALLQLTPRTPDLLVSGINYGENLGADVTISGTVGAALEGAARGIPALAVSLQTPKSMHLHPSGDVDLLAAVHFTRLFARYLLDSSLPYDADVLKVDIPADATPETPWRLTRVSRHAYYTAVSPARADLGEPAPIDYEPLRHPERTELDSDVYALAVDRVVSVAPLSYDLTARVDRGRMEELFRGGRHADRALDSLPRESGVL